MKADAIKITEGVYWIGVRDWDLRNYHGCFSGNSGS